MDICYKWSRYDKVTHLEWKPNNKSYTLSQLQWGLNKKSNVANKVM